MGGATQVDPVRAIRCYQGVTQGPGPSPLPLQSEHLTLDPPPSRRPRSFYPPPPRSFHPPPPRSFHPPPPQSEHRTLDPEEADFFYLPIYTCCFRVGGWVGELRGGLPRQTAPVDAQWGMASWGLGYRICQRTMGHCMLPTRVGRHRDGP